MVDKRVLYAARFLKPPGFFKRAEMREKPHRKTGPFENPVRRFVRLREKARLFSDVPLPRRIPIAKPIIQSFIKPIEGVPKVSPEVLQRRLDFLLSDAAKQQQLHAKLREGLTPYLAELYMWERQMRDLRKIYRAQYLQKLAEVTEEERKKQYKQFIRQRKESYNRKEEIRRSIHEENKRKAILRDTLRIEKKVTQALELGRLSSKKIGNIYWLNKLQTEEEEEEELEEETSNVVNGPQVEPEADLGEAEGGKREEEELEEEVDVEDMEFLIFINNFRLINVPMLSKELGNPIEDAKSIKHKIKGGDLYFRELLKESFSLLPEDASRYEDIQETFNYSDRAKITYSKMTDDEKLELLNKKIEMITERIDRDSKISGNSKDNLYIQLRDHLDAAKLAYLEKKNIKNNEN